MNNHEETMTQETNEKCVTKSEKLDDNKDGYKKGRKYKQEYCNNNGKVNWKTRTSEMKGNNQKEQVAKVVDDTSMMLNGDNKKEADKELSVNCDKDDAAECKANGKNI